MLARTAIHVAFLWALRSSAYQEELEWLEAQNFDGSISTHYVMAMNAVCALEKNEPIEKSRRIWDLFCRVCQDLRLNAREHSYFFGE